MSSPSARHAASDPAATQAHRCELRLPAHLRTREARPDASKVREFADDVRDGKFVLPIGRRMQLRDTAEAHVLGQKGGIGKILLLTPDSKE